jgi:anaerobic C4-dicarboxylate transporter
MAKDYEALRRFAERLSQDPDLQTRMKNDPVQTLKDAAADARPTPLTSDVVIYRSVVLFLGTAVLVSILGAIVLVWHCKCDANREPPQILTAIGSAAVGALAGLLAPSPSQK